MRDVVEQIKKEKHAKALEDYNERESREFIGRKLADRIYFRRVARSIRYYGSYENELNPV
jgi:hypothetical protein